MYKICVYTPISDKEKVKTEMFKAGGGKIGNYDSCSFEVNGTGQFRPLEGSNPHLGSLDKIEFVKEVRIEMVCEKKNIHNVIKALKETHPYETPAYDITETVNIC